MYHHFDRFARGFALLGGLTLTILIVLICASVLGRTINSILFSDFLQNSVPALANFLLASGVGPINGDFEIVEAGMAFTIFAFIPLCQLHFNHASVDIFTSNLPEHVNRILRAVIEIVFAAVMVLIAVQLLAGTLSKHGYGETTLLLQFPVWWAYACSTVAATAAAICAIYVAVMRVLEFLKGQPILPFEQESSH